MAFQSDLQRVRQLRRQKTFSDVSSDIKKSQTQTSFTGENPSFSLYIGVAMIALLKDLLDLIGVGSLPGIGFVVTACFTFIIWLLLATFDRSSQGTKSDMQMARGLVTIGIGLIEGIGFGLNFLPIELLMVIILYVMAKRAWYNNQQIPL
ncbi:MAG: hypothetical protein ACSLEX_00300 [Minisyncoccota bacterium]